VLIDDLSGLRQARGDAVVASLPTIAYAAGALVSLRVGAATGIGCALVVGAIAARRRPLGALSGLIAVVFAVGLAVVMGRPTAFFLPGILINGGIAIVGLGSLALRRPALAFTLAAMSPRFAQWRTDPLARRTGVAVTAVWSAVFALRFVVMGSCYLAGANPSVLAVVKVVLGLPLAAIAAAVSFDLLSTHDTGPNRPDAALPAPDPAL
jgi:hypothetical protein